MRCGELLGQGLVGAKECRRWVRIDRGKRRMGVDWSKVLHHPQFVRDVCTDMGMDMRVGMRVDKGLRRGSADGRRS